MTMQHDKILILDFGSQVTQLIARRVREAHVYCEVHPCDVSSDWEREFAADGRLKGVILSGDRKSTRLNSSHLVISYPVFCLKKQRRKLIVPKCHYILSVRIFL